MGLCATGVNGAADADLTDGVVGYQQEPRAFCHLSTECLRESLTFPGPMFVIHLRLSGRDGR